MARRLSFRFRRSTRVRELVALETRSLRSFPALPFLPDGKAGKKDAAGKVVIPPNSDLVFTLTLVNVMD